MKYHRKKFRTLLIQRPRITLTPITILSLVSKVFPNKKTATTNSHLALVSCYYEEAQRAPLLREALRITFATNPLQLELRNVRTRVPTLSSTRTHTHTYDGFTWVQG